MNDPQKTTLIEWREEFETGDPAIDHEHKEMINWINEFLEMEYDPSDTDLALDQLGNIYAWISAHFALEETTMRAQRYAGLASHKDDHEKLLDELRDLMEAIEQSGYSGMEDSIKTRMSDWFVNHFKTQDALWHSRSISR